MRRLAWMTPFALAALVACADGGDDMEGGAAATEADAGAEAAPAAALACAPTATGQELAERPSPYDSATISVGGGQAKVCYSRPALRGRVMLGGEAAPWGRLWRFGANEPTTIHLSTAADIAGAEVEPGSYSLYVVPQSEGDWTLIVNRSTSQWGHEAQYTEEVESQEVGRFPVRAEAVDEPVESFTIRPNPDGSGLIAEWQNSRIYIPVEPAG
jgi:hypothetical protein